jgi:VanZ family protein
MIYSDSSPYRWAAGTFFASFLCIVILTLAPFDFSFESNVSFAEIFSRFSHRSSADDWIANVLLYVPLGFSLAAWLWAKRASKLVQFVCVLLCAFSLSAAVEVLQVFLPLRVSASTDIYANSMGAVVGLLCSNRRGQAATFDLFNSIEKSLQRFIQYRVVALSIPNLLLVLMGYVLTLFLISSSLQNAIHLGNWTQPYFLLIGNDQAIDSSWEGYISKISIADQAVSEEAVAQIFAEEALQNSLVASYDLTSHQNSYPDTTGRSPKLIWQGSLTELADKNGSLVNSRQWLETEAAASLINQRIRQSSQFALSAVLATANVEQTSPLLSLSNQTSERLNFALVQQDSQLILRLRSSVNNGEGTNPELVVPNVFTDTNFHHLLITYRNALLNVYVDNSQNHLSFGVVLFQKLLPLEKLKNTGLVVCKVLYYALLFVPLGILTGLVLALSKRRLAYRLVLVAGSVLLAPLTLEWLLMLRGDELNGSSFLLGVTLTAAALLGTWVCRRL